MKWIAEKTSAIEMLGQGETIGIVDCDKPDGRELIPSPDRTTTQTNRATSTNIKFEGSDVTELAIEEST